MPAKNTPNKKAPGGQFERPNKKPGGLLIRALQVPPQGGLLIWGGLFIKKISSGLRPDVVYECM